MVQYADLIMKYAMMFGLPAYIVAAIIEVESGWNPKAISNAGAIGLMQIMPNLVEADGTARPTAEELVDPETNIYWGCRILGNLFSKFNSLDKALAGYYGGIKNDQITDSGWKYIAKVHNTARNYYHLAPCTPAFSEYARLTGCWEECAINLKGIATDALETGRKIKQFVNEAWGNR